MNIDRLDPKTFRCAMHGRHEGAGLDDQCPRCHFGGGGPQNYPDGAPVLFEIDRGRGWEPMPQRKQAESIRAKEIEEGA